MKHRLVSALNFGRLASRLPRALREPRWWLAALAVPVVLGGLFARDMLGPAEEGARQAVIEPLGVAYAGETG